MTLAEKAERAASYLERRTRDNGREFVCSTDNAPEWMHTMCQDVHDDMGPDDWRYQFIEDALDCITEGTDDLWVTLPEYVYTSEHLDWLGSNHARLAYADEYMAMILNGDYLVGRSDPVLDIDAAIWGGMVNEQREVLDLVTSWLDDNDCEG